jgi:hypothetical protein
MKKSFKDSFDSLKSYCESQNFSGWDPYDGLNSKVFQATPLKHSYLAKLAWIQSFKRSPVNFRRPFLVSKEHNAKGLGLFLSGYCNIYKVQQITGIEEFGKQEDILNKINYLVELLQSLQTTGYSGACWGYNFDWQAKAFFQPKYTPTVVATTFIGSALIDVFEITGEENLLSTARSCCDFILKDLNRTYDKEDNFAFSYSPMDHTVVFNASLLGSRLLSRVYSLKLEKMLFEEARRSVAFCCSHQQFNGAWSYGTLTFHQWVDNFHTGYNLECIADYIKYSGDTAFNSNLINGFKYYIQTFFTQEGIPKYYNNCTYPIDIHASAQLIITASRLDKFYEQKDLIDKVLNWTVNNMQSNRGYFYYQKNKNFTSRIPYMRWAQAWMFYALSEYLLQINNN